MADLVFTDSYGGFCYHQLFQNANVSWVLCNNIVVEQKLSCVLVKCQICSVYPQFRQVSEVLTSMEQPSMDPLSWAFLRMLKRSAGAVLVSYISPTPPVKSSMASRVVPPFRDS